MLSLCKYHKHFFFVTYLSGKNKLECFYIMLPRQRGTKNALDHPVFKKYLN
jgi:hypothetical protein